MSLVKTWYTPEAAASKFGLKMEQIKRWVEDGLVRAEKEGDLVTQVNIDDVRLEVEAMVKQAE
ncbi:MAG: MerR family transcriptional regulator [Desulfuromonadales bacterium]|nr:MerR family transcriptional regulator [Desulfuromonadales bacterium]